VKTLLLLPEWKVLLNMRVKMNYKELLELTYERAFACKNAGADAILIHSKKKVSEDIKNFMQVWKKNSPSNYCSN